MRSASPSAARVRDDTVGGKCTPGDTIAAVKHTHAKDAFVVRERSGEIGDLKTHRPQDGRGRQAVARRRDAVGRRLGAALTCHARNGSSHWTYPSSLSLLPPRSAGDAQPRTRRSARTRSTE